MLGVDLPLVQAPLGGGPGTPALTAAACEAGAFGILGAGYLDVDDTRDLVRRTRELTSRPFGVNLFLVPPPEDIDPALVDRARARLRQVAAQLGLEAEPPREPRGLPDADDQLEVLLSEDVPVVSFTFGAPSPAVVEALHRAGRLVMGTAQSVADARALVDLGIDVVVAQGSEAGGHRGGMGGGDSTVDPPSLVALVPAVVDAVEVPVVAAGGIMDGRGVVAALALGAQAALGTAFLSTPEAGTPAAYRTSVAHADETSTVVTSAFSGRAARGIRNSVVDAFPPGDPDVPPFPVMNYLTRPLRTAAAEAGQADALSLWAGQGVGRTREMPAGELVRAIVREAENAIARLS